MCARLWELGNPAFSSSCSILSDWCARPSTSFYLESAAFTPFGSRLFPRLRHHRAGIAPISDLFPRSQRRSTTIQQLSAAAGRGFSIATKKTMFIEVIRQKQYTRNTKTSQTALAENLLQHRRKSSPMISAHDPRGSHQCCEIKY
uniref:(northern house mosquito) hypothetical protein n=1 Tax=Culex pipiens TaxID=7175 RepID=A0A8D8B9Y6_CULPI